MLRFIGFITFLGLIIRELDLETFSDSLLANSHSDTLAS